MRNIYQILKYISGYTTAEVSKKSAKILKKRKFANSKKPKFVESRQIIIEKFQKHSGCQPKSMPTLKTKESAVLTELNGTSASGQKYCYFVEFFFESDLCKN